MSWSISVGPVPPAQVRTAAGEAFRKSGQWTGETEVRTQLAAAIDAAELLVSAVGEGRPYGVVTVTLSGHANPGHEPRSGYANDQVTVTVANASSRAPMTTEEARMIDAFRSSSGDQKVPFDAEGEPGAQRGV